ncbi:hypothetical protein [Alsobacter sp. SYSU BS001988]
MIDLNAVLSASFGFVRKTAGQVASSAAAALCVAAATHAFMRTDAPPAPPAIVVLSAAPAMAASEWSAGERAPAAQAPAFTITGAFQGTWDGSRHAFPMDGDPAFQASLSRPFVALASADWTSAAAEPATVAGAKPKHPSKVQLASAPLPAARPARQVPAPITIASASPPAPNDAGTAAPSPQPSEPRLFGFRTPRLLPSMDDVMGGVSAAASSLTRLATFQ